MLTTLQWSAQVTVVGKVCLEIFIQISCMKKVSQLFGKNFFKNNLIKVKLKVFQFVIIIWFGRKDREGN